MAVLFAIAVWLASVVPLFIATPNAGGWLLSGLVFGVITVLLWGPLVPLGGLGSNTPMVVCGVIALLGGGGFAIYCLVSLLLRGAGVHVEVTQR